MRTPLTLCPLTLCACSVSNRHPLHKSHALSQADFLQCSHALVFKRILLPCARTLRVFRPSLRAQRTLCSPQASSLYGARSQRNSSSFNTCSLWCGVALMHTLKGTRMALANPHTLARTLAFFQHALIATRLFLLLDKHTLLTFSISRGPLHTLRRIRRPRNTTHAFEETSSLLVERTL